MSYRVDRFNGTFLVSVDDGTIDTTTDLRFIGKNYAGYGEVQNENFLHLLENFANTSAPPKPIIGQIWYDSSSKKIKFYDGTQFKTASGSVAQATAPSGLSAGDFWFDTTTDQLYAWNGTEFVLVGPENTPDISTTAVSSVVVKDDSPTPVNHNILKVNINNQTIGVISSTAFTLNSTLNPISGFNAIKKGFTLINTDGTTGVTSTDHYYWGTASNALRLNGRPPSDYALNSALGSFGDSGVTIGDQNDLRLWIEGGDVPIIENQLGATNSAASIVLRIRTGAGAGDKRDVGIVDRTAFFPGTDNFYDLGKTSARWKGIYTADKVYGNVKGSVFADSNDLLVDSTQKRFNGSLYDQSFNLRYDYPTGIFYGQFGAPANLGTFYGTLTGDVIGTASSASSISGLVTDVNATPDTIALRDGSGNLRAVRFTGIADRADQLLYSSSYVSTSITATPTSIAVRDASGNITANIFNGTATAAQYADLAEKYLADKEYEVGTVVSIGGSAEITASKLGDRAIGAVSANPAFMMNSELEGGTYVALKGRVPVKVKGSVRKGDRLISGDTGVAIVTNKNQLANVFAIAIESNGSEDVKLVEAVII
jgi:hypothetical protein